MSWMPREQNKEKKKSSGNAHPPRHGEGFGNGAELDPSSLSCIHSHHPASRRAHMSHSYAIAGVQAHTETDARSDSRG